VRKQAREEYDVPADVRGEVGDLRRGEGRVKGEKLHRRRSQRERWRGAIHVLVIQSRGGQPKAEFLQGQDQKSGEEGGEVTKRQVAAGKTGGRQPHPNHHRPNVWGEDNGLPGRAHFEHQVLGPGPDQRDPRSGLQEGEEAVEVVPRDTDEVLRRPNHVDAVEQPRFKGQRP
jgi:hypothetical protein